MSHLKTIFVMALSFHRDLGYNKLFLILFCSGTWSKWAVPYMLQRYVLPSFSGSKLSV